MDLSNEEYINEVIDLYLLEKAKQERDKIIERKRAFEILKDKFPIEDDGVNFVICGYLFTYVPFWEGAMPCKINYGLIPLDEPSSVIKTPTDLGRYFYFRGLLKSEKACPNDGAPH